MALTEEQKAKLMAKSSTKKCANCGDSMPATAAFCPNCGMPVQAPVNINTGTPVRKRNVFLLIAAIIYSVILLSQTVLFALALCGNTYANDLFTQWMGEGMTLFVILSLLCHALITMFLWIGWSSRKLWAAGAASTLALVTVIMIMANVFSIVGCIFCIIGDLQESRYYNKQKGSSKS